jgi:uncharacterized protein YdhG (YjbR/CyaY superfamily)
MLAAMRFEATSVDKYLADLPDDRREALQVVRKVILDNLPAGYEEVMNWDMITYQVPLETHPDTYNKKPLMFAALASQKNHMAVYLSSIYAHQDAAATFEQQYRATGKRYDVGKSCVRFRTIDDLPLDLIGRTIAASPVDAFIAGYEAARASRRSG